MCNNTNHFDIIIIGAGPAGMYGANELCGKGLSVLVLERGKEIAERTAMNYGIGGAGTFSDGKLNLTSKIGGDPATFHRKKGEVEELIKKVDLIYTENGAEEGYSGSDNDHHHKLSCKANAVGVDFIFAKQRHIGTDRLPEIIENFYNKLNKNGIKFKTDTLVKEIRRKNNYFEMITDDGTYSAKAVIAAPGRAGSFWLRNQAHGLNIATKFGPIDVGIRVEFPAIIYEEIADVMYDAKFRLYSKSYDDLVRTFCTNPRGFIVKETHDDFVLVNGHAKRDLKTENTNFALLSRVLLTDPVEDTTKYGRDIARLATTIGGGKPIVQRWTDFVSGRRSTWARLAKSAIQPTLKDVTPGDISMAFPKRITTNLIEGLDVLDKIISGLNSNNTILYAPEIKFYDTKYSVSDGMETSLKNFFVAGDASGHSRGIIYSAVTGMLAARGALKNFQ